MGGPRGRGPGTPVLRMQRNLVAGNVPRGRSAEHGFRIERTKPFNGIMRSGPSGKCTP